MFVLLISRLEALAFDESLGFLSSKQEVSYTRAEFTNAAWPDTSTIPIMYFLPLRIWQRVNTLRLLITLLRTAGGIDLLASQPVCLSS